MCLTNLTKMWTCLCNFATADVLCVCAFALPNSPFANVSGKFGGVLCVHGRIVVKFEPRLIDLYLS